jgi:hypothetical protein
MKKHNNKRRNRFNAKANVSVEPHEPVKSQGLGKTSAHWHTVEYANNTNRANGAIQAILPECGLFCKRQNWRRNDYDS